MIVERKYRKDWKSEMTSKIDQILGENVVDYYELTSIMGDEGTITPCWVICYDQHGRERHNFWVI